MIRKNKSKDVVAVPKVRHENEIDSAPVGLIVGSQLLSNAEKLEQRKQAQLIFKAQLDSDLKRNGEEKESDRKPLESPIMFALFAQDDNEKRKQKAFEARKSYAALLQADASLRAQIKSTDKGEGKDVYEGFVIGQPQDDKLRKKNNIAFLPRLTENLEERRRAKRPDPLDASYGGLKIGITEEEVRKIAAENRKKYAALLNADAANPGVSVVIRNTPKSNVLQQPPSEMLYVDKTGYTSINVGERIVGPNKRQQQREYSALLKEQMQLAATLKLAQAREPEINFNDKLPYMSH